MRRSAFMLMLLLVYAIAASAAVHVFMQKNALFEGSLNQGYAFERILDRTADRPFVYRVLMPLLVNQIEAATPEAVRTRYQGAAKALVERYSKADRPGFWTAELERKYLITFVLMLGFAIAALFALRDLTGTVFPGEPMLRDVGPLLFATLLPLSFMNGGFLYDFSEMFFLFLSASLAWRRRYALLLPALALAVLNKETCALVVAFLLVVVWHREEKRKALGVGLAMVAVVAIVLLGLRLYYDSLPGATMFVHISENFEFWRQPASWFAAMTVFVPLIPFPRGLNLLMIVPLLVVLLYEWRGRPIVLRHYLLASAAINVPLFFLFCFKDETRNLSLMYPAVYLNVCHALLDGYGARAGDSA